MAVLTKVWQDQADYERQLLAMVRACPWLMQALDHAASLQLSEWCIAAGTVRELVWQHLFQDAVASLPNDVDLVYFHTGPRNSVQLQQQLSLLMPELNWEVTDQALVHTWHKDAQGRPVQPVYDLNQALASWPETATAVGVYLDQQGEMRVLAPLGLDDLFAGILRHNAAAVDVSVFQQRLQTKRFLQRWPNLQIVVA